MDEEADGEGQGSWRGMAMAIVAVVGLGALGYFLAHELSASARLQDCVLSGRTNCSPIDARR